MAQKDIEYNGITFSISYTIQNPKAKKSILFLHGWGSNKEIMQQAFGNYLTNYRHIYVDMPGFGSTPNSVVLTTSDYAGIIKNFLELVGGADIVVGHSFGGKVATLLNPNTLVLLSSAGILVPKPFSIRTKIALFKLLKPFGGAKIRKMFISSDAKDMDQNMYETFKNVVDEDFEDNFCNVKSKALLFWGKDDTATPLWSGKKIASLIPEATLYPMSGDHFFFLKNAKDISQIISKSLGE